MVRRALAARSPDLAERWAPLLALFDRLHVGQQELEFDGFDVADRVDVAVDVGDVVVFKATDDLDHGVNVADVGEEGVAHAFALGRAADDAGDVDQVQCGGHDLVGLDVLVDAVEPGVGHGHDADVGLDRGEGIVRGEGAGGRKSVE